MANKAEVMGNESMLVFANSLLFLLAVLTPPVS